jgi:hypothetical protein
MTEKMSDEFEADVSRMGRKKIINVPVSSAIKHKDRVQVKKIRKGK